MSSLKLAPLMLIFFFLLGVSTAGYMLRNYYYHLRQVEILTAAEQQNQRVESLHTQVRELWDRNIQDLISRARRTVAGSGDQISKALKVLEESNSEIRHAFFIDYQETIYLPEWRKFHFSRAGETVGLNLMENPDFKLAEILEYQNHQYSEAVRIYEGFWLNNPDDFQAANALARCLYKLEQLERAEKVYRQIYTQNPPVKDPGDDPLAITAAFQLLSIYRALDNTERLKTFGIEFYKDFLDEKWELPKTRSDFFKTKIQTLLAELLSNPAFAREWRSLLAREKNLEKIKDYVRFISDRIIPYIDSSLGKDYQVYIMSPKDTAASFLLIIPASGGHIVLDIDYGQFIQSRLLAPPASLFKHAGSLGLRLHYAGRVLSLRTASGRPELLPLSKYFPDLQLEIRVPEPWTAAAQTRLRKTQHLFLGGYATFVGVLLLIFVTLHNQIKLAELRSDFVSHVSHELKTPLTSLRMFSEILLSRSHLPEAKRRQYYEVINEEAVRLSRLIENVLDISKIERRKLRFSFKNENVNDVIRTALEVFKTSIVNSRHPLHVEFQGDGVTALDRDAFMQMLLNLLDNARKFSEEGSVIRVRSEFREHRVMISVLDHGIGMSKAEIRKVFRKFYQVRRTYEGRFKGVGLGLAIVKNIVQAHGGKIVLESEKGQGTAVNLWLPIRTI